MSGPDGDALGVEHLGDVVRMDAVHRERNHAAPLLDRRAEDAHTGNLLEPFHGVAGDGLFVRVNRRAPGAVDVFGRRPEADRLGDRRRAGLELVRDAVGFEGAQLDALDHVAAAQEGGHRLEQIQPAVEGADPRRNAHLVSREGVEVGAQRRHVHREMRHRLRASRRRGRQPVRLGDRPTGLIVPIRLTCAQRHQLRPPSNFAGLFRRPSLTDELRSRPSRPRASARAPGSSGVPSRSGRPGRPA
jgi:hypothetical protein